MKAQRDIFYSTTKQVTEDEYYRFVDYVKDNYEEWYENKVCYEVSKTNDNYFVTLYGNEIVTFNDIF
tara:strand:+ start:674 stop:874 length:201 start_codon:yes stop_codon:yes gene_type:complete